MAEVEMYINIDIDVELTLNQFTGTYGFNGNNHYDYEEIFDIEDVETLTECLKREFEERFDFIDFNEGEESEIETAIQWRKELIEELLRQIKFIEEIK